MVEGFGAHPLTLSCCLLPLLFTGVYQRIPFLASTQHTLVEMGVGLPLATNHTDRKAISFLQNERKKLEGKNAFSSKTMLTLTLPVSTPVSFLLLMGPANNCRLGLG